MPKELSTKDYAEYALIAQDEDEPGLKANSSTTQQEQVDGRGDQGTYVRTGKANELVKQREDFEKGISGFDNNM